MSKSELLFVMVVVVVLILVGLPTITVTPDTHSPMMRDVARVDQIIKSCKLYAQDHNGVYPASVENLAENPRFTTSTEAFNELIRGVDLGTEELFYSKGLPDKPIPPNQDGILTKAENCFIYVIGQGDETPARSPLIANEMASPGVYGANHPWLNKGAAIVGYCGGAVKMEKLTGKEPGATVRGARISGMDDIFTETVEDSDGRISGGLLAVPRENILLP